MVGSRVYLVGFMAAGKSKVGRALAERLAWPLVDLDELIEVEEGLTIAQIFAQQGEEGFRDLEYRHLLGTTGLDPGVIATGGGTFTFERNRQVIADAGRSVWLDVPFDVLDQRMSPAGRARRPLFQDREKARTLFTARRPSYALADHRIRVFGEETAITVADRICNLLRGEPCDT